MRTSWCRPSPFRTTGKVTPAEWERYAGTEGYLRNQGFYVYRERRLIIFGTWFGLARQAELTKLARVRIDMPNSLDGAWKIDVKKASAQLPPPVRDRLRRIIEPLGAASKRVYRNKGRKLIEENRIPVWSRIQNKNQISYRINDEHPMVLDLLSRLPPETRGDLLRVIEVAGASLPMDALFADLGGDSASVVGDGTSEQALRYAAVTTFAHLSKTGKSVEDVLTMMRVAEPSAQTGSARSRFSEKTATGSGSMNDRLSDLESMVSAALANQQGPTAENIRELMGISASRPCSEVSATTMRRGLRSVLKSVSASSNPSAPF